MGTGTSVFLGAGGTAISLRDRINELETKLARVSASIQALTGDIGRYGISHCNLDGVSRARAAKIDERNWLHAAIKDRREMLKWQIHDMIAGILSLAFRVPMNVNAVGITAIQWHVRQVVELAKESK